MLEQSSRFGRELFLQGVPLLLENHKAAVVRGHGSFAVGRMLEEVFQWTSSLGASCRALHPYRLLSPRDMEEGKGKW